MSIMHTFPFMVVIKIAQVQQSGTRWQTNLEIQTALMVLNDSWNNYFSDVTNVTSALEVY